MDVTHHARGHLEPLAGNSNGLVAAVGHECGDAPDRREGHAKVGEDLVTANAGNLEVPPVRTAK
eukprot:294591-Lingulodinium_polyedra.AAC.1